MTQIAPLLVSRVCGLPADAVDALRADGTVAGVRLAAAAEERARQLADHLGDALHTLVPGLDRRLRRAALRLRRDAHNLRLTPATQAAADLIAPRLDGSAARLLDAWRGTVQEAERALTDARQAAATELPAATAAVLDRLRAPAVARGLALASPDFTRELVRRPHPEAPAWDARLARTATAYLTRTALKPSPFGTLTTVGTIDLEPTGSAPDSSGPVSSADSGPVSSVASAQGEAAPSGPESSAHSGQGAAVAVGWVSAVSSAQGEAAPSGPGALSAAGQVSSVGSGPGSSAGSQQASAAPSGPGAASPGAPAAPSAYRAVSSSRAAALHLLHTWAASPGGPDWIRLLPHPGVRGDLAALPLYAHAAGVFLRTDEVTDVSAADRIWAVLPAEPVSVKEAARLLGTGAEEIARLVAMGLLLPVTPWALPDGRHFTALAAAADTPGPVADAVRTLADAEECLARDVGPGERTAAVGAARAALTEAYAALRRRPPDWLPDAGVLHEAVAHTPEQSPPLPAEAQADLRELGAGLARQVRRSALYDRMVRHFVRSHGPDGTCDLLAFCYEFLTADPLWYADPTPDAVPREPYGHRTLAAPAQTVFFQTAGPLLVVNRVHSGFSGMVARWAAVPALHDPIDTAVTGWLEALHPQCRVYQLSAHADWIEFQRPAVQGLPRVGWGPELAEQAAAARDLRGFALAHDPATGTLQATDPDGRPAAFAYLGAVPPHSLHGVDRLLATLSDPWTLAQPAPGTGHQPRLTRGNLVLRRATWTFTPVQLPRATRGQDPVDFLAAVERWRRAHGLPEEVFLTRLTSARHHKPQWLGFRHPHTVWSALRRIDDTTTAVRLTEALPTRHQHPLAPGGDGRPHATEYIALLRQAGHRETP